jgi:hypothetical protein
VTHVTEKSQGAFGVGSVIVRPWLKASLLLALMAARASAEEAPPQSDPAPQTTDAAPQPLPEEALPPGPLVKDEALLRGRVMERGTINPVGGARVLVGEAHETISDAKGRFELRVPAGEQSVVILSEDHEPLRVSEKLVAGQGLEVEYRLIPKEEKKRYRSRVRGESRHEGERFSLRDEELHMAPGSLGDPFRVIALLPGVAAPVPLLPLWVVRGASPGTNGFFLDGMRVPQLFHFLLGGGVIHSRLIDRVDFYPSAYDASFGRFAGGIIDGETRTAKPGYHAELELKIYDIAGLVEATLPKDVKLTVSGHYGWPAFIIKAFEPTADLQYWDFQLRLDWKGLTVQALGSFDALTFTRDQTNNGVIEKVADRFRLAFYRVQIRDRERWGRVEFEAAIVGGIDELASFGGTGVRKLSLSTRLNVGARWKRFRLLAGAELELQRFNAVDFSPDLQAAEPDQLGDFAGNRGGVIGGAFVEGWVDIIPRRLNATLGARLDFYHAGNVTLLGIDPRLQFRARLLPQLSVTGGTGLYQQAPSFPVGLPGIDTFALQLGLQRAWQSAVGIEAQLPKDLELTVTGYYQRFWNLNDVVLDFAAALCTSPPPESLSGFPARVTRQLDGASYGMEVLLRRKVGRVTGWIAYTLSKSERIFSCGLRPSDFDQRHVLNVVLQVRLPWKLIAGAHLYVATGRPYTSVAEDGLASVRNNSRLPTYVQLDLRIDREWLFKKWALAVFLEILNVTYSQSIFGVYTPDDMNGVPVLGQQSLNAFRWILPTLGIRGRI